MAGDVRVENSSLSIDDLKDNLKGNPQELSNYLRLAWAYYEEKKYESALTTLQDAGDRFPDDYEVAYTMGLILKKVGNKDEAQKAFQEVIRLTDEIPDEIRARMLRRFAVGHINMIENGEWNLLGQAE